MVRDSDRRRRSQPEEQRGGSGESERSDDSEQPGVRIIALGAVAGLLLFAVIGVAMVQSSPEETPSYSDTPPESSDPGSGIVEEPETPGAKDATEDNQETTEPEVRYPSLLPAPGDSQEENKEEETTIRGISGTVSVSNYDEQRFVTLAKRVRAGQSLSLVDVGVTTATTENGTTVKFIRVVASADTLRRNYLLTVSAPPSSPSENARSTAVNMNSTVRPPRGKYVAFIAVNGTLDSQWAKKDSQYRYFHQSRLCQGGEIRDIVVSVTGQYPGEGKVTSTLAEELTEAEQDRLCGTGGE